MNTQSTVYEKLPIRDLGPAVSAYTSAETMDWTEAKPGIFSKLLFENPAQAQRTLLVRLDPQASSPRHSHTELEQIYVISGSFHDGERELQAGDFCCRSPGQQHTAYSKDGALTLVTYTAA